MSIRFQTHPPVLFFGWMVFRGRVLEEDLKKIARCSHHDPRWSRPVRGHQKHYYFSVRWRWPWEINFQYCQELLYHCAINQRVIVWNNVDPKQWRITTGHALNILFKVKNWSSGFFRLTALQIKKSSNVIHWNPRVSMMPTLSSLTSLLLKMPKFYYIALINVSRKTKETKHREPKSKYTKQQKATKKPHTH